MTAGEPDRRERETFGSGLGAFLTMAGVAIGLGNVWRFPYMVGAYGGGAFLVVFLVLIFVFGIPCVMAEWTLGRHTRRGPLGAFRLAGLPGGDGIGFVLTACLLVAVSYYTVIVARVAWYLVASLQVLVHLRPGRAEGYYDALQGNLPRELGMLGLLLGLMTLVLAFGVRRGIERASRASVPILGLLLGLLLVRALTLPGAPEAALEAFQPRFEDLKPSTVLAAMGQVFFTLSLGGTFFLIYGSYLSKDHDIPVGATATALADTLVAVAAVLIVLPAAGVLGIAADQGPSLLFRTLPEVFDRMPVGTWFSAMFFLALLLAAFLSSLAGIEVIASGLVDRLGLRRSRALLLVMVATFVLAIPAVLSDDYIARADLFFGSTMQPVGSLFSLIAIAWFVGRGKALAEVNQGASIRVSTIWIVWIRYVVPGLVLVILIGSWVLLIPAGEA